MKYKILGSLLIFIGFAGVAFGISIFSAASHLPEGSPVPPNTTVMIQEGVYVSDSGDTIMLLGDSTLSYNNGKAQDYQVKIWRDMPFTNEDTGEITLSDLYFLNADLDGDGEYSNRIQYDYENQSLIYRDVNYELDVK